MAIVYACLVVRSYFLAESETDLAYSGVMLSRATLCEILAIKLLSRFASNHIQLVAVLTTSWNPLAGATSDIIEEVKHALGGDDDDMNYPQSAIEVCRPHCSLHTLTLLSVTPRWLSPHRPRHSSLHLFPKRWWMAYTQDVSCSPQPRTDPC